MFFKRKSFFFVTFILFVFALLTYQSLKARDKIFDFIVYPLTSVQRGVSSVSNSVKGIFNKYLMIVGKEEENKRLLARLRDIEKERNDYTEILAENKRLRMLFGLKEKRRDYVTTAEVFARDPTNWFHVLWINKGANDGISNNMAAVTPIGLVGRIHSVFEGVSKMFLITDVNSSVAVRVQSSRVEGILEGRGADVCYLKYVSHEEDVKIGDRVITSGVDGLYPEGLQVGYVSKILKKGVGLFQHIEVTPLQNLRKIEEVAILKR
ncbi:MAG TPA: rod shape-determining protein MreC [Nitrospiraceae bacterium]|nr:rod shape-determining protein MreC [Nitrospiraceae bacterium]